MSTQLLNLDKIELKTTFELILRKLKKFLINDWRELEFPTLNIHELDMKQNHFRSTKATSKFFVTSRQQNRELLVLVYHKNRIDGTW